MSNGFIIATIAVMAVITALLRCLPFLIFNENRKTPEYISWLGEVLPYAIIGMLCVYCLKGTSFAAASGWAPAAIATAVVVLLHVWKRNSLISIFAGTLCYMIMVQVVFV